MPTAAIVCAHGVALCQNRGLFIRHFWGVLSRQQHQKKGTGNLHEISTRLEAAQKAHGEVISEMRSLHDRGGEARANVTLAFSRRFQIVAEAKAAAGHPDGAVMVNPGGKAAATSCPRPGWVRDS